MANGNGNGRAIAVILSLLGLLVAFAALTTPGLIWTGRVDERVCTVEKRQDSARIERKEQETRLRDVEKAVALMPVIADDLKEIKQDVKELAR